MKLVIQIPCYNEEDSLLTTLNALPKKIKGIKEVEVLVINDGSVDKTAQIASDWGVKKIISFKRNLGLARAFVRLPVRGHFNVFNFPLPLNLCGLSAILYI